MTWQKILLVILFLGITVYGPLQAVYTNRSTFFGGGYEEKYEQYKRLYYQSQYVKKKNPGIINDEVLEAFAAGIFLRGLNPILIVHDQPPLGRYMVSASIYLFDNQNTILLLFLFSSLLGVYLIALEATGSKILAFIPTMFFANEPLFLSKFVFTPLLEPIQLPFIVFAVYFFIRALRTKHDIWWFIALSIMLGFVISTRFFALGSVLLFSLCLVLLWIQDRKRKIIHFFVTLPLAMIVLLASYTVTMMHGYSIIKTLGIQKYILVYHKSQLAIPFSFFDLILFNRWHTWWGTYAIQHDYQWILLWPISYVLSMCMLVSVFLKKIVPTPADKTVLSWIVCYSLFLSLGNTSTRYFLPLTPFLYIASVSCIQKLYSTYWRSK